jgi:hypothetical protein
MRSRFFLVLVLLLVTGNVTVAQTTVFTYQGKLADNGNPANGHYDFQFSLFDALSGGAQQGTTQTVANQLVTNGIFAVTLDFVNCSGCTCPTCFNGGPRFLAIAVRPTGGGSYTPLTDRQQITSTPYAVKSMSAANATTADGLSVACVNCVTSSQIASVNGSAVTGAIPVASVPAGSANYIQNNPPTQQASGNFNISGNGTAGGTLNANVVNATTQYNIGGVRVFKYESVTANTYAGFLGNTALGGTHNSFFGGLAAVGNTGTENSFFGYIAGAAYMTFDIDSVDPAFAPGTGTPEVGGLTSHEAQQLVRGLAGLPLVGGDIVEVAPPFDGPGQITALLAANLMFEFLCVMAQEHARHG